MYVVNAYAQHACCAYLQGTNSIINSYIPVVASGPGVSVCLALYNAVANLGGLIGPWVIGEDEGWGLHL